MTECEKQLAVIKIQLEELQQQLNEAKQYGVDQEILNKNLLRILRERANADRSITPKRQHHGYIILCSQQLIKKDNIKCSEVAIVWKTQLQTPYPLNLKSSEIKDQIFKDFVENNIFVEMGIYTDSLDIKTECEVNLQQYLFRANTRTGYWEIELYTSGEIIIPLNMLQPSKNMTGSASGQKQNRIKSNVTQNHTKTSKK